MDDFCKFTALEANKMDPSEQDKDNVGPDDEMDTLTSECDSSDLIKQVHNQLNELNKFQMDHASYNIDGGKVNGDVTEKEKNSEQAMTPAEDMSETGPVNDDNETSIKNGKVESIEDDVGDGNTEDVSEQNVSDPVVNDRDSKLNESSDSVDKDADVSQDEPNDYDEMSDEASVSADNVNDKSMTFSENDNGHIIMSIHKKRGRKRKKKSLLWSKPVSPLKSKRLRSRTSSGGVDGVDEKDDQDNTDASILDSSIDQGKIIVCLRLQCLFLKGKNC